MKAAGSSFCFPPLLLCSCWGPDLFFLVMEKALRSRPLEMKLVEMLGCPEGQQKPRKVVSSKEACTVCVWVPTW